jgi:hypothetical protein
MKNGPYRRLYDSQVHGGVGALAADAEDNGETEADGATEADVETVEAKG